MNTIIFSFPQNNKIANIITKKLKLEKGLVKIHDFPDGETYIKINSDVKNKKVILFYSLDHPNNKILLLLFMAQALKELGANEICLVSPYLPYMRQDKQFKPGEAVTSIIFAKFISSFIDNIVTVDPHLHRIKNISDIYSIPTTTLHATKPIAEWIKNNIDSPLIIGPDEESIQWVSDIAEYSKAPFVIAKKARVSDNNVIIEVPEIYDGNKTPVLFDDIISTGATMHTVLQQLLLKKFKKPTCIVIHALLSQKTYDQLLQAGAQQIVSCNTIQHPSNKIDITDILLEGINKF